MNRSKYNVHICSRQWKRWKKIRWIILNQADLFIKIAQPTVLIARLAARAHLRKSRLPLLYFTPRGDGFFALKLGRAAAAAVATATCKVCSLSIDAVLLLLLLLRWGGSDVIGDDFQCFGGVFYIIPAPQPPDDKNPFNSLPPPWWVHVPACSSNSVGFKLFYARLAYCYVCAK